jgi:protein FAM50
VITHLLFRRCVLIADEEVAVTYSYWDGSGHRREITVRPQSCGRPRRQCHHESDVGWFPIAAQIPKKTTIGKYLELIKQQLVSEFAELRGVSSDNLLYVKEDLIIPHVRVRSRS